MKTILTMTLAASMAMGAAHAQQTTGPSLVATKNATTTGSSTTGAAVSRQSQNGATDPRAPKSMAGTSTVGAGMTESIDFAMLDTDRDGALTREEAAQSDLLVSVFGTVDADADGKLTRDELNKWSMGGQR